MAVTNGNYVNSPIPNTTMLEKLRDGVLYAYALKAVSGHVLHDNMGCWTEIDEMTGDEIIKHAFYRGTCTCAAAYDFATNPREFYTVPENEAPENQIFGGGGNDNHEIM